MLILHIVNLICLQEPKAFVGYDYFVHRHTNDCGVIFYKQFTNNWFLGYLMEKLLTKR